MLKILVVEDDIQLATTIKYLVEDNPRYSVVATEQDAEGAIAAAEMHHPHIALVDLHLANGSTGFAVAVRLYDLGVPCLFVSGKAPSFAMPDLALGCLMKPFTADDVHRALALAEDRMRGREAVRPKLPRQSADLRRKPTAALPSPASFPRAARCAPASSIGSARASCRARARESKRSSGRGPRRGRSSVPIRAARAPG